MIPLDRTKPVGTCLLDCGESGSTLRFLLPVAGALGAEATVRMAGRLAQRPLGPLVEQLRKGGCAVTLWEEEKRLTISGQLRPGEYHLPGDVSSQFISGMLFALPLLPDGSRLVVEGARESASYLQLTLRALATFGLTPREQEEGWTIASQGYASPGVVQVEGTGPTRPPGSAWACWGRGRHRHRNGPGFPPGDRAVCRVLAAMGGQVRTAADRVTVLPGPRVPTRMDARDIPDLVPVLAAVAAATPGVTEITGAARLRLKESDRLETTARMLNGLGGQVEETADGLLIREGPTCPGTGGRRRRPPHRHGGGGGVRGLYRSCHHHRCPGGGEILPDVLGGAPVPGKAGGGNARWALTDRLGYFIMRIAR